MEIEFLQEIGLTNSEAKVYLALLELGFSKKGELVEKSKVSSSKIYELLEKLIQKGLVSSVVKSGVKYFEAASLKRLLDYMKEKKEKLKEQEEKLNELIPRLALKRNIQEIGSETQVFKGMEGAKTSFSDILNELKKGEEYFVLGISKFTPEFETFIINFHRKRAEKGIKCKIIVNELARDIGKNLSEIKLTKVKYIKKELFTPVVFILYHDKTLISIGLDEIFIQIKSKNLSDGLKNYAKYMWTIGKEK